VPSRNFYSVLSDDLAATRDWYVSLFGYRVEFDSDWFVHLQSTDPDVELGILASDHEIVPAAVRGQPSGGILTIVVEDVDAVHRQAVDRGVDVVESPRNLFYGQRRMLLVDPNGLIIDVSSECPPDPDWLASLGS
jgi:predicted enzyme related to lactoylglutathione lyase